MRGSRLTVALLGAIALPVGAVLVVEGAAAPPQAREAAAKRVTPEGVGGVKLGKTYRTLRRQRLVGRIRRGCPLGGPQTRSAGLKRPLRGSVNFSLSAPRRVRAILLTRGARARARGVGIGSRIRRIRRAYPRAKVNHGTDEIFRLTLVTVPKHGRAGRRGRSRLAFGVSTRTKRVTLIGVPGIPFCE